MEQMVLQCSSSHGSLPGLGLGDFWPSVSVMLFGVDDTVLILTAPTYSAELAPPKLRGFFVGMNGVNIALGYGLGETLSLSRSRSHANDLQLPTWAWRSTMHPSVKCNGEVHLELL